MCEISILYQDHWETEVFLYKVDLCKISEIGTQSLSNLLLSFGVSLLFCEVHSRTQQKDDILRAELLGGMHHDASLRLFLWHLLLSAYCGFV